MIKNQKLGVYLSPEVRVVELNAEKVLCSGPSYGGDGEPGVDPGWDDDYDF